MFRQCANGTNFFDGAIDDVRFFNRVLSADEMNLLAAGYDEIIPPTTLNFYCDVNPRLIKAETNDSGSKISLYFSKPLQDPTNQAGQFKLYVNGVERSFSEAALREGDSKIIDLTVAGTPVVHSDNDLKLSYTPGEVKYIEGNISLGAFSDQEVISNVIFAAGTGTADDPYLINSPQLLDKMRNYLSAHFRLACDLDLNIAPYNAEAGWVPIGDYNRPLTGSFGGAGHTVSNLYINTTNDDAGLFAKVQNANIKNLLLADVDIKGSNYVGGITGRSDNSQVSNCSVQGMIQGTGDNIGGLIGFSFNSSSLHNSYATCSVIGSIHVGGLIGRSGAGSGTVRIENCFTAVIVNGTNNVGGLAGYSYGLQINNSYAVGKITGATNAGGAIGGVGGTNTFENVIYNQDTTGQSDAGKGIGKTTGEMKKAATYANWPDFNTNWSIIEDNTYPFLNWQESGEGGDTDMAPPVLEVGYPKTLNISYTVLDLQVETDENGTAYYVMLDEASLTPSSDQVIAGQDHSGTIASIKGNLALTAGAVGTKTIGELTSDKGYKIYIVVQDTAGNTTAVQTVEVQTPENIPPSVPENMQAGDLTGTSMTLSWDASTDNVGVTEYLVEVKTNDSSSFSQAGITSGTSLIVENLLPMTVYIFRVSAMDDAGNQSVWSAEMEVATLELDRGGLNIGSGNLAITPQMVEYDNNLYLTWVEEISGHTQIRVKKYNGINWSNGDSESLNFNISKNAYNPVLAVYKEELYLSWYEQTGDANTFQVYVSKYDSGTNQWTFGQNISYSGNKAFNVKLAADSSALYALWVEGNGTRNQIRAKKFNGETWSDADNGSINYELTEKAALPYLAEYNGGIYAAWSEKGNIRVKKKNIDGTDWEALDTGSLNYDNTKIADMPILIPGQSGLYIIWGEQNQDGFFQVRSKKYISGTTWAAADQGSLNYKVSKGAYMLAGIEYQGTLYAAWTEKARCGSNLITQGQVLGKQRTMEA